MITEALRNWTRRREEARLMRALALAGRSDLRDLGIARDQVDLFVDARRAEEAAREAA